jgi:hypothetical protein
MRMQVCGANDRGCEFWKARIKEKKVAIAAEVAGAVRLPSRGTFEKEKKT